MSVQQHIALTQRRRCLGIKGMPVRDIHQPLPCRQDGIVREDWEREYHLVHLGVAVAAHAENLIFPRKVGGIFEKLLDFTEKFYIIVELVICIAGKSLLT